MDDNKLVLDAFVDVRYQEYQDGDVQKVTGPLALEASLEIIVNGLSHSLLMYSPGAEKELVTGFLLTEGLIKTADDITDIELTAGSTFLGVEGLQARAEVPSLNTEEGLPVRTALSLSSCGLCGKEDLEELGRGLDRVRSKQTFNWNVLFSLLKDLRRHQPLYKKTRGVHAAALYDKEGTFLYCFEDVGRHNALDKVIGSGLKQGLSFEDKLVVLSGRASLEMVLKTVRCGLPLLLCFSSPTVLAVEAAKALNLTLVGRHKDQYLAAYTHSRRLKNI